MAKTAVEIGANTLQYFSRNPRGGAARAIDTDDVTQFLKISKENNFSKIVAHAPYTMNLCSSTQNIRAFSKDMFEDDLKRLEAIPGSYYNFHPGSHTGQGVEIGIKQISDAPPVLFVLGHSVLLNNRSVGIVGTRNASLNGKNMTRLLACALQKENFNVVSGMAKGIDRAAHEGALEGTSPQAGTIAVLGTPLDEIYPKENSDIYAKIKERGCLVSEFAFGTQLSPMNFPRRNRIISGLSEGVVVIEAQVRSGSLITAREALSQGREVMAVPGFPLEPRSSGPNALIKDGATLIEKAQDVIENLNQNQRFHLSDVLPESEILPDFYSLESEVNQSREEILSALSAEPIEVDTLSRQLNLPVSIIDIVLLELELAGRLERHPGHQVSLIYGG